MNSYEKGKAFELCAKNKLKADGYTIVGERVKTRCGEIDILARRGNELVAVEVKQRKTLDEARACIYAKQMTRIAGALMTLASQQDGEIESCRIDVICFDASGRVEHIENAFYTEDFVDSQHSTLP